MKYDYKTALIKNSHKTSLVMITHDTHNFIFYTEFGIDAINSLFGTFLQLYV